MKDIIASLPKEKVKQDGLWTRFVLRPISFPVSWFALKIGLSPAFVSYFSGILAIVGGILFAWPEEGGYSYIPFFPYFTSIGIILLNIFSVLDCVDGNMARILKKAGPWGGWADAIMGFVAYTSVFFAAGLYLFWRTGIWEIILLSGLTSSANLLSRVAYQIYKNIVGNSAHSSVSFERSLAENVGITGFLMPLILIFHFIEFLPGIFGIVFFNAAFYGGGCLITVIKLARKAAINQNIT